MSWKFNFFQGQGIVREFFDVTLKNEILQKCQGNVRNFTLQPDGARMFGPYEFFLAKYMKCQDLFFLKIIKIIISLCSLLLSCDWHFKDKFQEKNFFGKLVIWTGRH